MRNVTRLRWACLAALAVLVLTDARPKGAQGHEKDIELTAVGAYERRSSTRVRSKLPPTIRPARVFLTFADGPSSGRQSREPARPSGHDDRPLPVGRRRLDERRRPQRRRRGGGPEAQRRRLPARSCSSTWPAASERGHGRRAAGHADLHAERPFVLTANEGEPNSDDYIVRSRRQRQHHRHARRRRVADPGRRDDRRVHGVQRADARLRRSASSGRARPSRRISSPSTSRCRTTRRPPG